MGILHLPAQRPATTAAREEPAADALSPEAGARVWVGLLRTSAARGGLAMVACLVLWSILPALLGWAPRVILSGSMEPRVHVGDVIVTREVPSASLVKGQVITVKDPDHPDRTRTHRLLRREVDGSLVIKGDANQQADSSHVLAEDVLGVGVIRVPWVGRPAYWAAERNWVALTFTFLILGWCLISAFPSRRRPVDPDLPGDADAASAPGPDTDFGTGSAPGSASVPGHGAVPGCASVLGSGSDQPALRPRRCRRGGVIALMVAIVVVVSAMTSPASAAFSRSATNAGTAWNAAALFRPYKEAVLADTPYLYWRLHEASGTAVADTGPGAQPGTLVGSPYAWGQAGALASEGLDTSLSLTTARINTNSIAAPPTSFSIEAWIKTSSTSGGRILGRGDATNATNSTAASIDRQLYLATTGKVVFGMLSGTTKVTVASTGVVNNGSWHHVVGTYASGTMRLYVDKVLQTSTSGITPTSNNAYWRAGGELMSGWLNNPTSTYFAGNLQELAVYTSALTSTRVAAHYDAGVTP